jgi:hypothetical protein
VENESEERNRKPKIKSSLNKYLSSKKDYKEDSLTEQSVSKNEILGEMVSIYDKEQPVSKNEILSEMVSLYDKNTIVGI